MGCLMDSAGGWLGRAALGDGTNFNADIRAFVSLGAPHSPPPEVGAGGRGAEGWCFGAAWRVRGMVGRWVCARVHLSAGEGDLQLY